VVRDGMNSHDSRTAAARLLEEMSAKPLGILGGLLLAFVGSTESGRAFSPPDLKAGKEALSAGRYEDALSLLTPQAVVGDAAAQFLVGLMHRDGLGVARDVAEAKRWLTLAAEQGYEGARFVLGEIELVDGSASAPLGPTRPLGRAEPAPSPLPAATPVAEPAPGAPPEPALKPEPRVEPGTTMPDSSGSTTGPLTERAYWLEIAAKQGNSSAQYDLARLYESGRGAPRDVPRALAWYRDAAGQGHVAAQLQLAYLLAQGASVPRDLAEASRWYRAAAVAGDVRGQFSLALLLETGSDDDRVEAVVWLERALAGAPGRMRASIVQERDRLASTLSPEQLEQVRGRLAERAQ